MFDRPTPRELDSDLPTRHHRIPIPLGRSLSGLFQKLVQSIRHGLANPTRDRPHPLSPLRLIHRPRSRRMDSPRRGRQVRQRLGRRRRDRFRQWRDRRLTFRSGWLGERRILNLIVNKARITDTRGAGRCHTPIGHRCGRNKPPRIDRRRSLRSGHRRSIGRGTKNRGHITRPRNLPRSRLNQRYGKPLLPRQVFSIGAAGNHRCPGKQYQKNSNHLHRGTSHPRTRETLDVPLRRTGPIASRSVLDKIFCGCLGTQQRRVPRTNLFEAIQELVLCSVPRTNLFVESGCHGQTCLSVRCYRQRSNARQAKKTFEFNRAFPWPSSRPASNTIVCATRPFPLDFPNISDYRCYPRAVVSGNPKTRLKHCTAAPDAPLIRLSIAETTTTRSFTTWTATSQ